MSSIQGVAQPTVAEQLGIRGMELRSAWSDPTPCVGSGLDAPRLYKSSRGKYIAACGNVYFPLAGSLRNLAEEELIAIFKDGNGLYFVKLVDGDGQVPNGTWFVVYNDGDSSRGGVFLT